MSNLKDDREPATDSENFYDPVPILIAVAKELSKRAHAPYSGYRVGAAILTADDRVYAGCNVENASYGLSICAERAAMAAAVAGGEVRLRMVALYAEGGASPTCPAADGYPCGACLQWMAEFSDDEKDFEIIIANGVGQITRHRLHDLLPHPFRLPRNR